MCFDLLLIIWFWASFFVPLYYHWKELMLQNGFFMQLSLSDEVLLSFASEIPIYSASAPGKATYFCFRAPQEILTSFNLKAKSENDFFFHIFWSFFDHRSIQPLRIPKALMLLSHF